MEDVSLSEVERLKEAVRKATEEGKEYRRDIVQARVCQTYGEFEAGEAVDLRGVEEYLGERGDVLIAVQAERLSELEFGEPVELNLEGFFTLSADVFSCGEIEKGIAGVLKIVGDCEWERAAIEVELAEFKTCPLCGKSM
jgi:hypothetical protein